MAQVWLRWHSAMSSRKHPISSIDESSPERPPWRLSPRPAPFRPRVYGAARSWPRGPDGGIPPQTAGIASWVPCQEQPGIRRPVPECIAGYADGTLAPTSVVAGPFGCAAAWGEEGLLRSRPATSLTCRKACEANGGLRLAIEKGGETETPSPPCCVLPRSIRRRFLPPPGGRGCGSDRGGSG
jgi:hypothetical protein